MSSKLFDEESDNEVTFKSNSEYAKKYNTLRRKEEWLKLKNKYGESAVLSEDSSSSEDDEEVVLTEEFERNFFKTLACLKKKDPRIYDKNTRFFDKSIEENGTDSKTKNKDKPMTIRDYNRKIIVENKGEISDEEENERPASPTYVQEQKQIKKMFSSIVNEDDDTEGIGGLFSKKKKTKEEEEEEEKSYHEWLAGQVDHLKNNSEEKDLEPLKEYWSNPSLDENEAFLRDYFLKQSFKEDSNKSKIPSYEEIVNDSEENLSEDEKTLGQQTEFEHKFNFRFEEPDQEFIKRYPRTLEHSLRKKDDKRARKRAEVRERKVEEKRRKKEEIAQLKSLKLKEIQEKIEKLKEITGNDQLAFKDEDIEGDFDPDAHDRRMQELFNEEYYGEEVDVKKPTFPDIDQELEIENWDQWNSQEDVENTNTERNTELHCEDENFNMDCDFDPSAKTKKSLVEELKDTSDGRRKRRKRKNKLAEALARSKPVFDPQTMDKTFAEYLDEYYKLDCEDVIGDMPCRFKYREVPPLDFGLTTEEILLADDQELNRWYPLKKTLQHRPDHFQINDQKILQAKARNLELKKKILPSLFKDPNEENEGVANEETQPGTSKRKRNKKKKKNKNAQDNLKSELEKSNDSKKDVSQKVQQNRDNGVIQDGMTENKKKKKDKKKNKEAISNGSEIDKLSAVDNEPDMKVDRRVDGQDENKSKKKQKKNDSANVNNSIDDSFNSENKHVSNNRKRVRQDNEKHVDEVPLQKKKKNSCENIMENSKHSSDRTNFKKHFDKNKHKKSHKNEDNSHNKNKKVDPISTISDERFKAYGLNPKKYKNFMKFKEY